MCKLTRKWLLTAPSSTNKTLQELDHSKMLKFGGRSAGSHYFGSWMQLYAAGDQMGRNIVVAVFMSSSK